MSRCRLPSSCAGNNICDHNHTGPRCDICIDPRWRGSKCNQCFLDGTSEWAFGLLAVCLVVALLVLGWGHIIWSYCWPKRLVEEGKRERGENGKGKAEEEEEEKKKEEEQKGTFFPALAPLLPPFQRSRRFTHTQTHTFKHTKEHTHKYTFSHTYTHTAHVDWTYLYIYMYVYLYL